MYVSHPSFHNKAAKMPNHPQRTHIYQNHHFDSTRWDYFESRADDIVIATSYKAGTTWTQVIVAHLLFPDGNFPASPAQYPCG